MKVLYETLEYDPASENLDEFLEKIRTRLLNRKRRVIARIYYILDDERDNRKLMELLDDEDDPVVNVKGVQDRLIN